MVVSEAEGKFLDVLYQGVSDSSQLTLALELIQNMFGCRGASLVMVDGRDPTASFVVTSGVLNQHVQRYSTNTRASILCRRGFSLCLLAAR